MDATSGSNPTGGAGAAAGASAAAGAGAAAGTPAAPGVGAAVAELPLALKVSFALNTKDGLRKIFFDLEKDSDGVKVKWTITFTLSERADTSSAFETVVSLNVIVPTTMHDKADKARHGLTPTQAAHATGPAGDAAKAAHGGTLPLPAANKIIAGTLNS